MREIMRDEQALRSLIDQSSHAVSLSSFDHDIHERPAVGNSVGTNDVVSFTKTNCGDAGHVILVVPKFVLMLLS